MHESLDPGHTDVEHKHFFKAHKFRCEWLYLRRDYLACLEHVDTAMQHPAFDAHMSSPLREWTDLAVRCLSRMGRYDEALARLQPHIDAEAPSVIASRVTRAEILSLAGRFHGTLTFTLLFNMC